jgi:hypothetical protein
MPATDIALALGKAIAPQATGLLRSYGRRKYDEFIATYTNVFSAFLAATENKCGTLKTLLNPDVPISLRKIYVQTFFDFGDDQVSDVAVVERIKCETGGFAITGLAGSGKSMFMKWAALSLIEQMPHHQRIPLFIEVRDLDLLADKSFDELVFDYCADARNKSNLEQFRIGLREGIFILMLDGVDEAPADRLTPLLSSIQRFHNTYRQCSIVASVRPGTQLPNIAMFRVFPVRAMTLKQVTAVVEKAPYNEDRKRILLESLKDGLYETHKSFLSNPLLVTIMLITFDDASRVPSNLTGFYSAAFDALFSRHDWSKGIFVRKRATGLEKLEFEKVFTYLCYQSYFYSSYAFTRDKILELIESSIKSAGINVSPESYLQDCIVSVCLRQIDEPKIIFVHRSFQEYFTAKFIARYSGPKLPKMIDWLAARSSTDNSFLMTVQLNREAIARAWGVPKSEQLIGNWRRTLATDGAIKIFEQLGILTIFFELRTGNITGYMGQSGADLDLVNALLTLGVDAPSSAKHYYLLGNVYGGRPFTELSDTFRSLAHKNTGNGEIVSARLNEWPDGDVERGYLTAMAEEQVARVEANLSELKSYLSMQDSFADMVELVHPFEPGAADR